MTILRISPESRTTGIIGAFLTIVSHACLLRERTHFLVVRNLVSDLARTNPISLLGPLVQIVMNRDTGIERSNRGARSGVPLDHRVK